MLDSFFILSYLCLIIAFQSSIGVGVLVLGTPFLLILNYNILMKFSGLLLGASAVSAMTYRHPRRLDTTLLKFVADDADIA